MKIGLLSTLTGPFQALGEDGIRGTQMALDEFGYEAGGMPLELIVEGTNAMASSAIDAATHLVNQGAELIVGPLSGDEGIAIRDFANEHPEIVVVNGTSGSQPIFNPAPNFFSFSGTGVQWVAGLGSYCYRTAGYRKVATVGEAYSFMFAQIGGFSLEFLECGGEIARHIWCSVGTQDYTEVINQIPADADAIYTTLSGTDGIAFMEQYRSYNGKLPLIGGSVFGDQSILNTMVNEKAFRGIVCCSIIADDNPDPNWLTFADNYCNTYGSDGFFSPSVFAYAYYVNTKALLLALNEVGGNLSRNKTELKSALANMEFQAPASVVRLDHHRVGIYDTFISQINMTEDGHLYTSMIERVPAVNMTMGKTDEEWLAMGQFGIHNMPGMKAKMSLAEIIAERKRMTELNHSIS